MTVLLLAVAAAQVAEPPEAMRLARRAFDEARLGRPAEAAASLEEAIRLAPANPLYRSALGGVRERQGQMEAAVSAFSEAVRLDPGNAQFRGKLETASLEWGAALAREGRYRAGLKLAEGTAQRFPESAPVRIMLGLFQTRNQQNVAAVESYRRALALDPGSAGASAGLAIAQSKAGLDKEALATFEAGIKRFPADAAHRQGYGVLLVKLSESGGATRQAARLMLQSALDLDSSLSEPCYQLGYLALADSDAAGALRHLEAAERNGLDEARLHYAMARALRRLGRTDEAAARLRAFAERKAPEP